MLPYKRLLRPVLFSLPPERSHRLGELALRQRTFWRLLAPYYGTKHPSLGTSIAGIQLASPVGVSAGFDKDCRFLSSLMCLGFGYVVGGTVTLAPQPGNPSPRLLRDRGREAIINSLGFPSQGAEVVAHRLSGGRTRPLFISISGVTPEQMVESLRALEPWADGIEVNISSPNTAGLRAFHEPDVLKELLERVNDARSKPLFVKMPPYAEEEGRQRVLELVATAREAGVDGVTAANTRPTVDSRLAVGGGGLSGRPVFENMLRMVADVRREAGQEMVVNGCGGVFTAEHALLALEAGADTVQIYTGLIYEGPGIARRINRGLAKYLDQRGMKSVTELKPG